MKKKLISATLFSIPFFIFEILRGIYFVFYLKSFDTKFEASPISAFYVHCSVGFIVFISVLITILIGIWILSHVSIDNISNTHLFISGVALLLFAQLEQSFNVFGFLNIDYIDYIRLQICIIVLALAIVTKIKEISSSNLVKK